MLLLNIPVSALATLLSLLTSAHIYSKRQFANGWMKTNHITPGKVRSGQIASVPQTPISL